jgi:hypothetical protein
VVLSDDRRRPRGQPPVALVAGFEPHAVAGFGLRECPKLNRTIFRSAASFDHRAGALWGNPGGEIGRRCID